jgi:hypothetical protein
MRHTYDSMTQFLGNEIFNFYYLPAKTRNYVDELKSFDDVSNPEYVFWATPIPKKCVIRVRVQPGKAKTQDRQRGIESWRDLFGEKMSLLRTLLRCYYW